MIRFFTFSYIFFSCSPFRTFYFSTQIHHRIPGNTTDNFSIHKKHRQSFLTSGISHSISIFYFPIENNRQYSCCDPPERPRHPDSRTSKSERKHQCKSDSKNQVRNRRDDKVDHCPGTTDDSICHKFHHDHEIPRRDNPKKHHTCMDRR